MKHSRYSFFTWLLLLFVIGLVLVGCAKQPTTQPVTGSSGYASALAADYDGALDVPTQLALGTIRLEETDHAVTAEQASLLLPLWQSLQSGTIKGDSERNAVLKQIERTMTDVQIEVIRSMQLTQADFAGLAPDRGAFPQGGMRQQGGTRQGQGSGQGGQGFDPNAMATRRAQMETMSEQDRQQMVEQFRQGSTAGAGTSSNMAIASVVRLLAERSGQAAARPTRAAMLPTETPAAIATTMPTQTLTLRSTATQEPTAAQEPTATLEPTPVAVEPTAEPTATPAAEPTSTPATANTAAPTATPTSQAIVTPVPALAQIEDTDPGPPFTISISSNTATQDPLVEASQRYKITGLVRNDGTQTYDVSALHVTFYDADGFRGTFTPAIRDGKLVGGEWDWHGEIDADFSALLLAPGEVWPFNIAITAQNMASFLIHPDAVVATREWVPVEVSNVRIIQDNTGFVRFTGTATNTGTVKAKNVTVAGTLLDADGYIVSVGSTLVMQENIAPGESVSFDLRVERQAYATFQLYAQAERDWN